MEIGISGLAMTTLFIPTYYNAPHFMEFQLRSLRLFIQNDFEMVVVDDSKNDTKCLLSDRLARAEISNESKRLGLRRIQVPQNIHKTILHGGLVPNGLPADHPTERHRACLHWLLRNHKSLGFDKYDTLAMIESDMFVRKSMNIKNYIEDYDLMGPGRTNVCLRQDPGIDQQWPAELKNSNEITISFFPMYMLFVNMRIVQNLEDFDIVVAMSIYKWVDDKERFLQYLSQFRSILYEGHDPDDIEIERFAKYGFSHKVVGKTQTGISYSNDNTRTLMVFSK